MQEERTNNDQGEGQQEEEKTDDVPMADVVVATPLGKPQRIIEKVLSDHLDPCFLNNWKGLPPAEQTYGIRLALGAYKKDRTKFENQLTSMFGMISDDVDDTILSSFVSGVFAECVRVGLITGEDNELSNRIVAITHGLDQEFIGTFDLQELDKHVRQVMKWHELGDHKYYRSPSFAMVQSSGMGKTKLMQEHTRQQNINDSNDMECRLILGIGGMEDVPPNHEKHYHAMLRWWLRQSRDTRA